MKQFMKKFLLTVGLSIGFLVPFAAPALAQSATPSSSKAAVCEGLGGCSGNGADINAVLTVVLNIMSAVVGFIAVIMIIVGGLKYIMSQGDSNSINSAKNTLLYAIIGIVIVALAQVIVRFVLSKVK